MSNMCKKHREICRYGFSHSSFRFEGDRSYKITDKLEQFSNDIVEVFWYDENGKESNKTFGIGKLQDIRYNQEGI